MGAAPRADEMIKYTIEVLKGPHVGLKMGFAKDSIFIGRGPENDVVLANDPRVSRQHAEIRQRSLTEFVVINVSQKNFILANGHIVESELLKHESVLVIGDTEIVFKMTNPVSPTPSAPQPPAVSPALSPVPNATSVPQVAPSQVPTMQQPVPPPVSSGGYQPPVPSMSYVPSQNQSGASIVGSSQPQALGSVLGHQDAPLGVSSGVGSGGLLKNPKVRFYGLIALLGLIGFFLFSPSNKKSAKDPNEIRTSTITLQDTAQAEKRTQELLTLKKEKYDTVQYRRAQENFVKGFRDFQQGQYARAREAFQVVLNLDPDNELAKRYFHLSKIKFDELVKFNMLQGNRYREKKNWKMCQSNYSNVMKMLLNRTDDPTYKEAQQYFQECTLNLEGRF